ncbi:23S rRNA (adenine(2030)-N(6))-methyltransferase RlmJ, partial [Pseudomonas sp.]|uniref:23S rRNA (adenine(2030)-N(6))-methyltransferase RlmJ n=1 Tax=Pseudomonas sp. TaxID=306 RepID=UPI0028AB42CB
AADYLRIIMRLNTDGELRYYPGSPELARRLMRQQDRALLNEKHPEDGPLLKENMKKDPRVAVHLGEGWHVPRALLPVQEKRAIMLIDPPFEQADALKSCTTSM